MTPQVNARIGVALAMMTVAGGRAARADDLWSSVAVTDDRQRAQREYERAMLDGDDAVAAAVASDLPGTRQRLIDRAIGSYELAARARPDQAEPHFRAASVLRAFHIDCRDVELVPCQHPPTAAIRARLIEHWIAFEALAPGDPRITEEVLFERAVQRTKLGTDDDLRAARDDYQKLLDLRPDGQFGAVLGNLAETDMMLGDLDGAIEAYRRTIARGADLSQEFGLAVALDRDEQGSEARAIIAARGDAGLARFQIELRRGTIFFVPEGEELYYLALGEEALGNDSAAIELWDGFISSGAHPQFDDRARHNRDALLHSPPGRPPPPRRTRGGWPPPPPTWTP